VTTLKAHGYGIIKDSLAYTVAKIIPGLTGLISVIVFFRLVGAEEYGRYTLLFSFLNIVAAFCFGWLNQSVLRYYGQYKGSGLWTSSLLKGFGLAFLISVGLVVMFYWNGFPMRSLLAPQIFLVYAIALFTLIRVYFQARQTPQSVVKLTFAQSLGSIIIPVFLIQFFQASYISILVGISLAYLIPTIIIVIQQRERILIHGKKRHMGTSSNVMKKFVKYGGPLSFWFVLSLSLQFLDRFFIEKYWGVELMGSYAGFSELVTRLFSVILFPITLAIHPRAMNLWNDNKYRLAIKEIGMGILMQISIFLFCFFTIFLFKEKIFNGIIFLVPQMDRSLLYVFLPLLTGGFLWQIALLVHKPLELKEWSGLMLVMILISVGWNIFGNTYFLPRYGVIATAYTSMFSAGSYVFLAIVFSLKTIYKTWIS